MSTIPASAVLATYRVGKQQLFLIGTYERGVTAYSQQIRALNLAWGLIETGKVSCTTDKASSDKARTSIAIVGGGFAGLSVAAGLIKKRANAHITIFEYRDTLLPLQQGSDTRWLHPRIYDWPANGSEVGVAMLPVLNWTAARASDVAAQLLSDWKTIVKDSAPVVYCNTRHLQIHRRSDLRPGLSIEWVGDQRNPDGTVNDHSKSTGSTQPFDIVIVAAGFGLERESTLSYWRNDNLGQPSLEEPQRTYLVSGQGDGAMIEVLRLRISQYRQDRILEELFAQFPMLLSAIRKIHRKHERSPRGLFDAFESLGNSSDTRCEFDKLKALLAKRLRRDTEVVLHVRERVLAKLFENERIKISFQNKFLVYLLYRCGGFVPTTKCIPEIMKTYSIPETRIIRRHGSRHKENMQQLLSKELNEIVEREFGVGSRKAQTDTIRWRGGFFGYPGPSSGASKLNNDIRKTWRKEYLPGPTVLTCSSLCASIAGAVAGYHPASHRLRVTLHRAMTVGGEELLQQCSDYVGLQISPSEGSAAARTFPARIATIGLAYRTQQIVRSRMNVSHTRLEAAMKKLNLRQAASAMSPKVHFVLAVPILQRDAQGQYALPSPVAGVLYLDSSARGFFLDNQKLTDLVAIVQQFLSVIDSPDATALDRVRNLPLCGLSTTARRAGRMPQSVKSALDLVSQVLPPRTDAPFQFNFDYSDFVPN